MASNGITFTLQCLEVVRCFKVEKGYTHRHSGTEIGWHSDKGVHSKKGDIMRGTHRQHGNLIRGHT